MTGKRKRYHHGDLRAALIAAATTILEEGGIGALSLRGAARRAGVSQAAPYRHFADKEGLLAAVAAAGFIGLSAAMGEAASKSGAGSVDRVRALGLGYVAFAIGHPEILKLMFGHEIASRGDHPDLMAAAGEAYGMIAEAIARRLAEPGTAEVDPALATVAAWSTVHGLATLLAEGQIAPFMTGGATPEALARAVTGIFAAGLANPAGFRP